MQKPQELAIHEPDLRHDYFFVQKESKEYQTWSKEFILDGDAADITDVYVESRQEWMKGKLDSWYIEDGSGNAPSVNRHYFFKFEIEGKTYKLDLYDGLKVRILAPTDEHLKSVDGCEGVDFEPVGPYNPDQMIRCTKHGNKYIAPSGQACWYCDQHKPDWAGVAV